MKIHPLLLASLLPLQTVTFTPYNTALHKYNKIASKATKQELNESKFGQTSQSSDAAFIESQLEAASLPTTPATNVLIYDTSLRDGTQGESISVSCEDKLKISLKLGEFGVDFIEAGWPGSNPKDAEFFQRAQTELPDAVRSKLVAFGSTRRKNITCDKDPQIKALIESGTPTVCIVAKSHGWQVTEILRAGLEENLCMIGESVQHLKEKGKQVFVDLEHFYDGYKHDPSYALECCNAAVKAGADTIVLCDTNGGAMPWEVQTITSDVVAKYPSTVVGCHVHNDCGLAVSNSLMAAQSGAGMIQGTMNGIGERTGNANLCTIIPTLAFHTECDVNCAEEDNLRSLTSLSRFIDEVMNLQPNIAAPFVGSSAFAHKGGLHVAAMERSPDSYQHIDPALVGNEKRVLVSELSGRQNIIGKIEEVDTLFPGLELSRSAEKNERALSILERVKSLENIGYTFEGADASVHLMVLHGSKGYCSPFRVLDYSVMVFDKDLDSASRVNGMTNGNEMISSPMMMEGGATARAIVKVENVDVNSSNGSPYTVHLEVSEGDGPVDALASALKNGLQPIYGHMENIELTDYKVRILDPETATAAATRVMIDFRDTVTNKVWTTVSVDRNIISASLNALVDGYEYGLLEHNQGCVEKALQ